MAKIVIEFDTVAKSMTVTRDGEAVDNVVGAYLGQSYDRPKEFRCEVMTHAEDEASGVCVYTRLVAAELATAAEARDGVEPAGAPGFLAVASQSAVAADVAEYFGRAR